MSTPQLHRQLPDQLRIIHIKNDPPIKSLKRRSLSGAGGSAFELIESMGVGFGSAHPPDQCHQGKSRMDQSFLGLSLVKIKEAASA
jgi:hypothetical protein